MATSTGGPRRRQHDLEREIGLRPPRLTGQDVRIQIRHDDGRVEEFEPIEIGPVEITSAEYLGETTTVFVDVFKGAQLTLHGKVQPRPAEENPELPVRADPPAPTGPELVRSTAATVRRSNRATLAGIDTVVIEELPPGPSIRDDLRYEGALMAWVAHEVECEEFDRRVCSGPLDQRGEIRPASTYEHNRISEYARRRSDEVLQPHLRLAGANREISSRAHAAAQRMTHDERIDYLRQAAPPAHDFSFNLFPRETQHVRVAVYIAALHFSDHQLTPRLVADMEATLQRVADQTFYGLPARCRVDVAVGDHGHVDVRLSFSSRQGAGEAV